MKKVFFLEDDPILGEGLITAFEIEGFATFWAHNCEEAVKLFATDEFDLAILDINLPDGSGMDVCKMIREKNATIPIIFLTAKTDEATLLRCLDIGGNDFVKKPFSQKELLARMNVFLKRSEWQRTKGVGGLFIDHEQRKIRFGERELELNRRQYDILAYFLEHPGKIITREQLLERLDKAVDIYDRTIDSHLSQTRKILKNAGISNVKIASIYGVGYRLEIDEE